VLSKNGVQDAKKERILKGPGDGIGVGVVDADRGRPCRF